MLLELLVFAVLLCAGYLKFGKVCSPDLAVLFSAVNLGAGHEKDR